MELTYPVLAERVLPVVARRAFGLIPSRRALMDLPQQVPGTVLVFEDGGGVWRQGRGRLNGTEPLVVNAIAVSLVQTRTRTVDVEIAIPSSSAAFDFTVSAQFNCRVVSPERVAENGPIDLARILADFLCRDRGLLIKGQQTSIEDVKLVRVTVDARVRAYCDEHSPEIPGVHVALASVQVLTPAEVRDQERKMTDAEWAHRLASLLGQHEDADVRRLGELFKTPEYAVALGHRAGKVDLEKIIGDLYADRRTQDSNVLELLKVLEKNGQIDRLPINGQLLVNKLIQRLAGVETAPAGNEATAAISADDLRSLDGPEKRKEERFAVDNHSED